MLETSPLWKRPTISQYVNDLWSKYLESCILCPAACFATTVRCTMASRHRAAIDREDHWHEDVDTFGPCWGSAARKSRAALDDDEMSRLVSIVVEEFGPALARTQFNDAMLALFENIAGLETIPIKTARQHLNILWSKYEQATKANHAG